MSQYSLGTRLILVFSFVPCLCIFLIMILPTQGLLGSSVLTIFFGTVILLVARAVARRWGL